MSILDKIKRNYYESDFEKWDAKQFHSWNLKNNGPVMFKVTEVRWSYD